MCLARDVDLDFTCWIREKVVTDETAAGESLSTLQQSEIETTFRYTSGEEMLQLKFQSLALRTSYSIKSSNITGSYLSPKLDVASNPIILTRFLDALPEHLKEEWIEWEHDYKEMSKRNPKLALYDMLSMLSETNDFSSWPSGLEIRIRDWVDSGNLEPQPVVDRLGIITPEFYHQLRELRSLCNGWLQWDGAEVRFISDAS